MVQGQTDLRLLRAIFVDRLVGDLINFPVWVCMHFLKLEIFKLVVYQVQKNSHRIDRQLQVIDMIVFDDIQNLLFKVSLTLYLMKFTKLRDFPLLESALFVLMSYSSFQAAEGAGLTGK